VSVLRYIRLDVFSNQPFTGIHLGVFPDAAGIDERRMRGDSRPVATVQSCIPGQIANTSRETGLSPSTPEMLPIGG
jgi:hypothetical protein